MKTRSNWSLIGIADHQGVLNVGGRIGAAHGPAAFRQAYARLRGRAGVHKAARDFGNYSPAGMDVARSHAEAAERVRAAHAATGLSVVVGGGHDHGFSHLRALAEPGVRLGCINLDAHLDVRKPGPPDKPVIGSGSPFYLALEAGLLAPDCFVEFGIQDHCNAPELWHYVEAKGVWVVPWRELRRGQALERFAECLRHLAARCDRIVISLDLDAVAWAYAPGVSAPQAEGFTSAEAIEMMEIAGATDRIDSLGIFELNPQHDPDGRTAVLAATAAYHFVAAARRRATECK